ncbi:DUF485 domain-containing protein [Desulfovibrio sp. OttesenSCG-928-A18]|nr:DUF485 domain-containing protein [Desulfovibrio sp. OttesenSCG-928-A18]
MASELTQRIQQNPQYQRLLKRRNILSWSLTGLVLVSYYGFILVVAFGGALLARPVAPGMTSTWGIPVAFGIILLTIVLTAIYVRKANREYGHALKEVLEKEV